MTHLCLGKGVGGEIGLVPGLFVFGQIVIGFDEEWFPAVLQQMDWNQSEKERFL